MMPAQLVKYELKLRRDAKAASEAGDAAKELTIRRALKQFMQENSPEAQAEAVTGSMSGLEKAKAGFGKAFVDLARGGRQVFGDESVQSEIDQSRQLDKPLMGTGAGLAGNIAGNIGALAPVALIPGANMVAGAALTGGALGAAAPIATGESRLASAGLGAAGGLAGGALGVGARKLLNPKVSKDVKILRDAGVKLTPNQMLGGIAARAEEGMVSVPGPGDLVRRNLLRARDTFNEAVFNKGLAPLGAKVSKIGHDGLDEAFNIAEQAYDTVLPQLTIARDKAFNRELRRVANKAAMLPKAARSDFFTNINELIGKHFSGTIPGTTFKREIDAELGRLARENLKSPIAADRRLGRHFSEVQLALHDLLERGAQSQNLAQTPELLKHLKGANEAWRNLIRIEDAVKRGDDGIFTPAQLNAALKSTDKTFAKRQYSRGKAPLMELSRAGKKVLARNVPDSGTPYRGALMGAIGGATALDPVTTLTTLGAVSAPFTKAGQAVGRGMVADRPQVLRDLGRLAGSPRPLGIAGSVYARDQQE